MIALLLATQVAKVVVYPDRAEVTRRQQVTCTGRPDVVEFEALPPSADEASLRATASDGTVEAIDWSEEPRRAAFGGEAAELHRQIRAQEAELARLRDAQERSAELGRLSMGLEQAAVELVSTEIVRGPPDVRAWRDAFGQTLQARLDAAQKRVQAAAQEREARRKLEDLTAREARMGEGQQRRDRRAVVTVSCGVGKGARVELSYVVGGASWQPAYEARSEEERGKVGLSLFATVRQSTGESWQNADLVLSTALPSADATPPEARPLRIYAVERPPPKKVLVRRDEQQRHAEETGAAAGKNEGLEAVAQGLSVQLAVKGVVDVQGDGTPARLFVASAEMPATFAFRAVPRQVPAIFRVADVTNTAPFPLLAGAADLFRRGNYVGRVPIDRAAEGARFHLSFGLEERLRVKRLVLEEIRRETGLFKNNQRFRYAYRLEVQSLFDRKEHVELAEAVPVSELDDVEVAIEDATTKGYEPNATDGILTWKLDLAPGEKRDVTVAFHVDVPTSYTAGF